jgi:hypothetical protein
MLPLMNLKPFYPPQWGVAGSDAGLGIRLLPGAKVFYVQSTHPNANANNDGTDPDYPLATIQQAINKCTANKGDIVLVGPGHASTIATASGLTVNKAGISIIGVGQGAARPTLTFNGVVGASIVISAANVTIENFLMVAGLDGLTNPLHLQAADITLKNIEWRDTTDIEAVRAILTTAAADRLTVDGLVYNGFVTGDACVNAIRLVGVDMFEIKNCRFLGNFSTAIIEFITTLSSKGSIHDCLFLETGTTNFSKNVVNTGGLACTWSLYDCFDLGAGVAFGGGSGAALSATPVASIVAERMVEKSDGAVLNGADDLFVISGGPIMVLEFVGIVTTIIGGAANCQIVEAVASPAGNVNLSTSVAIDADAVGTSYTFTAAAPGVLTPTTAGGLANVPSTKWLCPIGTINATCSAAQTGVIKWYMVYRPLSPNSVVSVAA